MHSLRIIVREGEGGREPNSPEKAAIKLSPVGLAQQASTQRCRVAWHVIGGAPVVDFEVSRSRRLNGILGLSLNDMTILSSGLVG